MNLPDSGARKEFESGAVRDISEGKGRCDLLPLDVVNVLLNLWSRDGVIPSDHTALLFAIQTYLDKGDPIHLLDAVCIFVHRAFQDVYTALLELAKHYEDGARKYSDNNWRKGIPIHYFIDSAIRHYLKWLRGDADEPHDRAFLWNLVGAYWTHINKPEMRDLWCENMTQVTVEHDKVGREPKAKE